MNVLVVEDENLIREVEIAYLKQAGFAVMEADNGDDAIDLWNKSKFDLVILDINLPKRSGTEVCKQIRTKSNVPIIMVTAKTEEIDELLGLEIGADDYIKKPFSPGILIARVKALLRRNSETVINIANLSIDPDKLTVTINEKKVDFTVTEFNIVYTLASNKGRVFSRDQIMDRSYNTTLPTDVFDRTIDAHIKNIRKKLKNIDDKNEYILTVIGKGYKFNDSLDV